MDSGLPDSLGGRPFASEQKKSPANLKLLKFAEPKWSWRVSNPRPDKGIKYPLHA